jgi:hypothetical protein
LEFPPLLPQQTSHPAFHSAWLEQAVFGLDRWLRQRQGVLEYSDNPDCVFRIQRAEAETPVVLSDGTRIAAGDAVLNIHLWNEQFPSMGPDGATMRWARAVAGGIDLSLRELAQHLRRTPELDGVVALRADMRLGTAERSSQLARISSRYGFEPGCVAEEPRALQRLGENIFLVLLVLATNPVTLRAPVLWRDHTLVYLSRSSLERRYATRTQGRGTRGATVC